MFAQYKPGFFVLTQDDIEGICNVPAVASQVGVVALASAPSGGGPFVPVIGLVLLAVPPGRRRRPARAWRSRRHLGPCQASRSWGIARARRRRVLLVATPIAAGVAACGRTAVADDGGDEPPSAPTRPCNAVEQQRAIEGFDHVPICSPVTYASNPPSSGNHYPIWSAYEAYPFAVPEGYWVHDLEHGAVVFSYNCPDGCDADVGAAQATIDALPDDPLCDPANGDARVRMTLTPDPNVTARFAASAWGWTLRADCFDPVAFGAFVQVHYGNGREVICAQGETDPVCGD